MSSLEGRKVLVLGASSGIGKAFAVRAAKAGADVLFTARRADRLEETKAEAGSGTTLAVDIGKPEDCARLGEAAAAFGPIDVVLSSVGTAPLRRIEETTAEDWHSTFRTNVVGLNCAIAELLPSLADGAIVVALSSEAVDLPRWALAAYGASKAALESSIRAWRIEHPRCRFGVVGVGATVPTEFGAGFEMDILNDALEIWTRHGQAQEGFMDTEEVGEALLGIVASILPFPGINMERILLRTPAPVMGSSELMRQVAQDGSQ